MAEEKSPLRSSPRPAAMLWNGGLYGLFKSSYTAEIFSAVDS